MSPRRDPNLYGPKCTGRFPIADDQEIFSAFDCAMATLNYNAAALIFAHYVANWMTDGQSWSYMTRARYGLSMQRSIL